MKKLKHWTACIVSGFDSVISQVENHESVVSSSIRELQEAAVRARVNVNRLKRDIEGMRSRQSELARASERWTERAQKLRDSDQSKALECLRRRKQVEAEIERLSQDIPRHAALAQQIESDVSKIEGRIEELKLKKRAFSSRASRAKAFELSDRTDAGSADNLEDVFDRWEIKLARSEIGARVGCDTLEDEFTRAEEDAALQAELDSLPPREEPKA